ncbi:MAG: type II secretion system protein GspD [Kangiellaceae bacterium]|nr:type II secretion system protein GspD [Kangiellaceae bacterium]|tara:strand:- start:2164 stop:4143 length:1980 start_codon:yes stop_codon:yes gene_type:complete
MLAVFLCAMQGASYAASKQGGGITLNMKDAEIEAFINDIGRLTGKTFIISPRVKGKITVISQHPMTKDELYEVFLATLKVHGFSAVEEDGVVQVLADQKIKSEAIPMASATTPGKGSEIVTRVIRLDNVSAQALVPVLRPLVPQHAHLVAYRPSNVIIIADTASNIRRLMKIIAQVDQADNEEVEVINLKHASAAEVVRILQNLEKSSTDQNAPPSEKPTLVADERTNSILLSGTRGVRLRLRSLIAHLDTPLESEGNTKVFYLKYAKAEEISKVLTGVSKSIEQSAPTKGKGSRTTSRSDVNIQPHEATNSLVITAPPDMLRSLDKVIRQLDIRRAQVLVEAIIVEISESEARELGVEWIVAGDTEDPGSAPVGIVNFGGLGTVLGAAAAASTGGDAGVIGAAQEIAGLQGTTFGLASTRDSGVNFGMLIRALESNTDSNLLSTPSVITLDNEEASIIVGQEVPFVTGSTTQNNSNPFQTIQREEVGVKLIITPQINEGNAVKLKIKQEVSGIDQRATAGASDIVTTKREIETTVMIDDGETIVLGGLMSDEILEDESKIPGLGSIPILGRLFGSSGTSISKRNLMIFIKPSIMRDQKSLHELSNDKYNFIRAQQLEAQAAGVSLMPSAKYPILKEWDDTLTLPPTYDEEMQKSQDAE